MKMSKKRAIVMLPLLLGNSTFGPEANNSIGSETESVDLSALDKFTIGELNNELPQYLAAHRSHSSHGSHRSSSGSNYRPAPVKPSAPAPQPSQPRLNNSKDKKSTNSNSNGLSRPSESSDPLGQPARPFMSVPPLETQSLNKVLSDKDKRKNIILRVQLTLEALEFYEGKLDGVMGAATRKALNRYRLSVGLQVSAKLDLATLNSLGIMVR